MSAQGLYAEFTNRAADFAPSIDVGNELDEVEFDYSHVVHILTSQVRNHYLKYVQNLLTTNFQCCTTPESKVPENVIGKCAIMLEEKAARSCMVVNLYRKSILQIIQNIRDETNRSQLNECIEVESKREIKPQMVDASVQTVPHHDRNSHNSRIDQPTRAHQQTVRPKTLDEKLRYFEFKMNNEKKISTQKTQSVPKSIKKPKPAISLTPSFVHTPESLPPPATPPFFLASSFPQKDIDQDIEDDITRELHKIFGTPQFLDPVEEIFGESISLQPDNPTPTVVNPTTVKPIAPSVPKIPRPLCIDYTDELNNSIWPCELHRQRLKLHRVLEQISEKGLRHTEKVRRRYLVLFGEDDDDEFGPYSPSLAMNDILMSSCKRRIAPWVVKALMVRMQNGQIANRYLFKKIAKRIAEGILVETQLPDEAAIRDAVMHFFTMYPQVNTLADMEAIA